MKLQVPDPIMYLLSAMYATSNRAPIYAAPDLIWDQFWNHGASRGRLIAAVRV